jgi:hypothetical protein
MKPHTNLEKNNAIHDVRLYHEKQCKWKPDIYMVPICSQIRRTTVVIARSEAGSEDGKWVELAQDRVQWRALELAVMNLRVLLPHKVKSKAVPMLN